MSADILLYLTADSLRLCCSEGGRLRFVERYAHDESGVAEFRAALEKTPRKAQFSLLIDVADEGFNLDHVPATRGRDRQAMLERKLNQQYYGSSYTAALSLGRESDGRRDERVLFSALTRPVLIDPWLDALIAAQVRVRGVHSVPFLLDRVMTRAKVEAPSYLLINFSPAGIRQTYFSEGRLRFSRLAGGHDHNFEQQLQTVAEEVRKTLAYLSAQRLTRRSEVLPIVALVHAEQFDALRERLAQASESPVSLADVGPLCDAYSRTTPRECGDSLAVLLSALTVETQCAQMGGSEVLRFQRLHQIRKGLYLGAMAVLATTALIGALRHYETHAVRSEADNLKALASAEDMRYRRLIQALPALPAPLSELNQLFAGIDRIEASRVATLAVFRPLSQALDQFPELDLESLAWRAREEGASASVVASALLRMPLSLAGDQRGMLEASERFVDELGRHARGRVRLLRRPIDIQSSQTLRGRAADQAAEAPVAPTFEVEFDILEADNA